MHGFYHQAYDGLPKLGLNFRGTCRSAGAYYCHPPIHTLIPARRQNYNHNSKNSYLISKSRSYSRGSRVKVLGGTSIWKTADYYQYCYSSLCSLLLLFLIYSILIVIMSIPSILVTVTILLLPVISSMSYCYRYYQHCINVVVVNTIAAVIKLSYDISGMGVISGACGWDPEVPTVLQDAFDSQSHTGL